MNDTAEVKGLTLNVYRSADRSADGTDCTNNGYTARFTQLTLVGIKDQTKDGGNATVMPLNKDSQVFAPTANRPAVILVKRRVAGRDIWSLVPHGFGGQWFMAGGNYAATSDSRFGDITGIYGAIAVHDRVEGERPQGY